MGLSPHVRGNPGAPAACGATGWSIPACAGEPETPPRTPYRGWVYPRMCGGTDRTDSERCDMPGLSPHVRGNRMRNLRLSRWMGSIPACAGEPNAEPSPVTLDGVYPRMCGGTEAASASSCAAMGLSPHVRGNQCEGERRRAFQGSIPACAGEPPRTLEMSDNGKVYPRMCGGTRGGASCRMNTYGLSPHVRGNPRTARSYRDCLRSIPACAGEPVYVLVRMSHLQVYPRMCGGTCSGLIAVVAHQGLSPHVRGNHHRTQRRTPR